MIPAMVLAAGLGTRLRPLTDELPKPLAWVGDKPMLFHIAMRLQSAGLKNVVVNAHHHADILALSLANMPLPMRLSREVDLLGSAGGIANAKALLRQGDVLAWLGDILADVDIEELVKEHVRRRSDATLAIAPLAVGMGPVGVGHHGEVVRLRGQIFGEEVMGAEFVGVQVMGARLRNALPEKGCFIADCYVPQLRAGARITTIPIRGSWTNVGTVDEYLQANMMWLAERGLSAYVAPTATVEPGVNLSSSVVGEGAKVIGQGDIRGCVIWPGATARAPLAHAIVTTRTIVSPLPPSTLRESA